MDNNPYATPVDTQHGKYDKSPFRGLIKAAIVVCATLAVLDFLILYKGNLSSSQFSPAEILSAQFEHELYRRDIDLRSQQSTPEPP